MKTNEKIIDSLIQNFNEMRPHCSSSSSSLSLVQQPHRLQQWRGLLVKVRLKWIKNRGFDHIIDRDIDIKAASFLKDAIAIAPQGFLSAAVLAAAQRPLDLSVPVLRFLRRYRTLFKEFPHPRYPSLPCFRLTSAAALLHSHELAIHRSTEPQSLRSLTRLLMMTKSRAAPLPDVRRLRWDLGLPHDFDTVLLPRHPHLFSLSSSAPHGGAPLLRLLHWDETLAVSSLQKTSIPPAENEGGLNKRMPRIREPVMAFPMNFPRGYGERKAVQAWMNEFQRMPYVSPYESWEGMDARSDLMEKRVVGVLHELLSLTVHKKLKRNYLRGLREELGLPEKFTRIFTRYPGIFYLSMKCRTTTVVLREGYASGELLEHHPLVDLRNRLYYVMRTGIMRGCKGIQDVMPALCGGGEKDGGEGQGSQGFNSGNGGEERCS